MSILFRCIFAKNFLPSISGISSFSGPQFSEIADGADVRQRLLFAVDGVADAFDNKVDSRQGEDPADGEKAADNIGQSAEDKQTQSLLGVEHGKVVLRRQQHGKSEEEADVAQRRQDGPALLRAALLDRKSVV